MLGGIFFISPFWKIVDKNHGGIFCEKPSEIFPGSSGIYPIHTKSLNNGMASFYLMRKDFEDCVAATCHVILRVVFTHIYCTSKL